MARKVFIYGVTGLATAKFGVLVSLDPPSSTMGSTILLIDDSAILRRIATNVLGAGSGHHEVVTATRATEGFARACGILPDLILIDAYLAGTPKSELCQRFLEESRTGNVPVILLAGRGTQTPSLKDLPENIVEILAKPFTPEQLLASVTTVLAAAKTDASFAFIRKCLAGERVPDNEVLIDRLGVSATVQHAPIKHHNSIFVSTSPITTVNTAPLPIVNDPSAAKRVAPVLDPLRSAFKQIDAEKRSGKLSVSLPNRPSMEVFFDAGKVVVVVTKDAASYRQDVYGVLPAKVSPATLEAAVDEQESTGVPFVLTLGARGLLSKAMAVNLVHRFGQRYFAQVWEMRSSSLRCDFTVLDAMPGFALRLEPRRENVTEWLYGTLRCLTANDIAGAIRHDGLVGTPTFTRQGVQLLNSLELTVEEKDFVRRINSRLDLPKIAKDMGIAAEAAYLILYRFRALDMMEYRPAPAAYVVTPRTNVRRVLPLRR